MTDQALDSMLRRVLLDVDCQQYGDAIDELPECDFSPAFEKKMQKLIRRADHPIQYQVVRVAACLLLAALLSGCTALAISPEARMAFVGWVRGVSEGWFMYHYTGETQGASTDTVYCPAWVPDGYEPITEPKAGPRMTAMYENPEHDMLVFDCVINTESAVLHIENTGVLPEVVYVGDIRADLYLDPHEGNANALVWEDKGKGVLFLLHGPLTGEELLRIAESIEVVQ